MTKRLKLSEVDRAVFPAFKEIDVFKSYGNKYFRLSVDHVTRDYRFRGYVCGLQNWADYTPEGLQKITDWMNQIRNEVVVALKVVEKD